MHQSILVFRNFRYLKLALLLVTASLAAYIVHDPFSGANGGTWLGYTLGTLGAVLIVWLAWFGIRKRRYGVGTLLLEDWASAHVYLGLGLLVIATLHTGFEFGLNVHTLAYGLMLAVILSGVFGLYAYIRFPALRAGNRAGLTLEQMMAQIADMRRECHNLAISLPDAVTGLLAEADANTRIGGGLLRQLSGRDPHCPTERALNAIRDMGDGFNIAQAEVARRLVSLLAKRVTLLQRARRDVQYKALFDIWLFIHVPLTCALLAALLAHVVAVFFYW